MIYVEKSEEEELESRLNELVNHGYEIMFVTETTKGGYFYYTIIYR